MEQLQSSLHAGPACKPALRVPPALSVLSVLPHHSSLSACIAPAGLAANHKRTLLKERTKAVYAALVSCGHVHMAKAARGGG